MRHPRFSSLLSACVLRGVLLGSVVGSSAALATPVYLRLDSRFPSGHYQRQWLESRTRRVQVQRWLKVETRDKKTGWLPEDHVLTALKLADQATLTESTALRENTQLDAILGRPTLEKGTTVLLLEIKSSWARVRALPKNGSALETSDGWVPTGALKAVEPLSTSKAFVHTATTIFVAALPSSRKLDQLREASFVRVLSVLPEWLEVRTPRGPGFIKRSDAWIQSDLGEKGARPLFSVTPLRARAYPYADLVRSLSTSTELTIKADRTLRWGQAEVKDLDDEMWWPMNNGPDDEKNLINGVALGKPLKLATTELFNRKIFDMASSRAIPQLKFVSATGVFRTVDGEEWTKVPLFQDQNYPMAIANGGAVFVGPYVSDDNGETFEQWIRWDTLVATLEVQHEISAKNIQIMEIKPQDFSGRKVTLQLNLGLKTPVRVSTEDQGMSWRAM